MAPLTPLPGVQLATCGALMASGVILFALGGFAVVDAASTWQGCPPYSSSNHTVGISCGGGPGSPRGVPPALAPGLVAQLFGLILLLSSLLPGVAAIRKVGSPIIGRRIYSLLWVAVGVVCLYIGYAMIESGNDLAIRISMTCQKLIYCMNVQSVTWMNEVAWGSTEMLLGTVFFALAGLIAFSRDPRLWNPKARPGGPNSGF